MPDDFDPSLGDPQQQPEPAAAPPAPAAADDGKDAQLTQIQEENRRLRELLNETVRMRGEPSPGQAQPPQPPATPASAEPPAEMDFVGGMDLDAIFDRPGPVLNALMNKVFHAGREQAMQEIPQMVRLHTAQVVDMQMKSNEFWRKNEDLREFSDYVGMVATQVQTANPAWNLDQIYDETAKVSRERLKLLKPELSAGAVPGNPALPSPGSGRKPAAAPAVEKDPNKKELDDLLDFAGG